MTGSTARKRIAQFIRPLSCFIALAMVFTLIGFSKISRPAIAKQAVTKQADEPQAIQTVFTNPAPITIPDSGNASPYPSTIAVSGISGNIPVTAGSVKVTLNNFSHTFPDDIGVVLVGPTGAALLLMDGDSETPASGITFTISDTGATPLPDVDPLTNGTFRPAAYFTGDPFPAPGPGTTYNHPGPAGGNTATFSSTFGGTAPNGNWNLFIVDFVAGDSGSIAGGWSLEIVPGAPANCTTAKRPLDFNGDGKTDFQVTRNAAGQLTWFTQLNGGASSAQPWGLNGDQFVPADYDGDGKADIAVWRSTDGNYYILNSGTNTVRVDHIGVSGDNSSVVGDYDGDGKADPAQYRSGATAGSPSFWLYHSSVSGLIVTTQWGQNGDFPAPGDYDGDGKADFVVQRNNGGGQAVFISLFSGGGSSGTVFGTPTDVIVPGLYDSDCKTDIATIRGNAGQIQWNILNSTTGAITVQLFGASATDFGTQGDYDGDGRTDLAVWRPNADPNANFYYYLRSSDNTVAFQEWGQSGDYPTANYNSH